MSDLAKSPPKGFEQAQIELIGLAEVRRRLAQLEEIDAPTRPPRSLEELLRLWGAVIAACPEGWARGFALSIQRSRRRPDWSPTERQLQIMRQMVSDLISTGDDGPLFNHAEGHSYGDLEVMEA